VTDGISCRAEFISASVVCSCRKIPLSKAQEFPFCKKGVAAKRTGYLYEVSDGVVVIAVAVNQLSKKKINQKLTGKYAVNIKSRIPHEK
jgi:hypothetical protein